MKRGGQGQGGQGQKETTQAGKMAHKIEGRGGGAHEQGGHAWGEIDRGLERAIGVAMLQQDTQTDKVLQAQQHFRSQSAPAALKPE